MGQINSNGGIHVLESLLSGQLVVRTRFDNLALLHEMDLVALLNSTETVRNRDRGPTLRCAIQRVLNDSFTIAIESRRGFVKEQDRGVTEQSTGDGDTLLLAAAELTAFATDFSVEATITVIRDKSETSTGVHTRVRR